MKNIIFVCTGNTCRSLMAEGLLKKKLEEKKIDNVHVCSAGIAACSSFRVPGIVVSLMSKEGIDVSGHISTPINYKLLNEADIVLVMEDLHKQYILEHFNLINNDNKIVLLKQFAEEGKKDFNIGDPIGKSDKYYQLCFNEINRCLVKFIEKIKK